VRFRGSAGFKGAAAAGRAGKHPSVFSCGLAEYSILSRFVHKIGLLLKNAG
jgi:hypothetical protein